MLHWSPLTTKWKLSQFVAMPVWYGVGVEIPLAGVVDTVVVVVLGVTPMTSIQT